MFLYYKGHSQFVDQFSFSAGASLHTIYADGRVLPSLSQKIFLVEKVDKRGGKMIVAHCPPL